MHIGTSRPRNAPENTRSHRVVRSKKLCYNIVGLTCREGEFWVVAHGVCRFPNRVAALDYIPTSRLRKADVCNLLTCARRAVSQAFAWG